MTLAYAWRHRAWPDLDRPRRFTEWVQWRKLHDRDLALARLTDKAHSKAIVADALGDSMVVPTLWEGNHLPADPPWAFPFVVKSNHGCGDFVVVRTVADYARARRLAPRWLAHHYGRWLDEWHYSYARRMILVEPFVGRLELLPLDYKLYVFGGRAAIIQLHERRGEDHRWSQFDRGWRHLSTVTSNRPAPASLPAMIAAAEQLAAEHDFLRVDFYEVDGRALFGEFCLFPGSGLDRFDPVELDDRLGALWSAQHPEVANPGARRSGERADRPRETSLASGQSAYIRPPTPAAWIGSSVGRAFDS